MERMPALVQMGVHIQVRPTADREDECPLARRQLHHVAARRLVGARFQIEQAFVAQDAVVRGELRIDAGEDPFGDRRQLSGRARRA